MHIQVITFTLDGIDEAAYRAHAEQSAPVFAALPGLRAKIWLANEGIPPSPGMGALIPGIRGIGGIAGMGGIAGARGGAWTGGGAGAAGT